jgi:hypothetical protein
MPLKTNKMNCEHTNCKRKATTINNQYFEGKWYCTFHANKATKQGRIKRKTQLNKSE